MSRSPPEWEPDKEPIAFSRQTIQQQRIMARCVNLFFCGYLLMRLLVSRFQTALSVSPWSTLSGHRPRRARLSYLHAQTSRYPCRSIVFALVDFARDYIVPCNNAQSVSLVRQAMMIFCWPNCGYTTGQWRRCTGTRLWKKWDWYGRRWSSRYSCRGRSSRKRQD